MCACFVYTNTYTAYIFECDPSKYNTSTMLMFLNKDKTITTDFSKPYYCNKQSMMIER